MGDTPLPASTPDRREIAGILLRLATTRLTLRLLGLKRTYRLYHRITPTPRSRPDREPDGTEARRLAELYRRINEEYSFAGASCLVESFALWRRLRRKGIGADLRLGVRTLTGRFESHAWVEYEDVVLNDLENISEIYTPFDLSRIEPDSPVS